MEDNKKNAFQLADGLWEFGSLFNNPNESTFRENLEKRKTLS